MSYFKSLAVFGAAFVLSACNLGSSNRGQGEVNTVPVAQSKTYNGAEDAVLSDSLVASVNDGDALEYAKASDPLSGSLSVATDGTFTYTPNVNFNGRDSFTFVASDDQSVSNIATVTLNISAVNDAPTASTAVFATQPGDSVTGQLSGNDIDGDAITYAVDSAPSSGGVVVSASGGMTYTPNAGFTGVDSFTFVTSDGSATSIAAPVQINVNIPNSAPTADNLSVSGDEDTGISGQVTGADVDGDAFSFAKASDPANGSVAFNANGMFTYTPAVDFAGSDSFTFTANDGAATSAPATVDITVNQVGDVPIAKNDAKTISNRQILTDKVIAVDGDGDTLIYNLKKSVLNGSLTFGEDGNYSYTPNTGFVGNDRFIFTASDASNESNTATVLIMITANGPPVANDLSVSGVEDGDPVTGKATATDPEDEALVYTLVTGPNAESGILTFDEDGSFSFTPQGNYNGEASLTYTANDGADDSAEATVTITINSVNDVPVANNANFTVVRNTQLDGQVSGNDAADGDSTGSTLTFNLKQDVFNGTLALNADGSFTYTSNVSFVGTDEFIFSVTDLDAVESTNSTVEIVVTATPSAAESKDFIIPSDVDGENISFTVHEPDAIVSGGNYPLVLHGHGYGGSKINASLRSSQGLYGLLPRGYGVISIDQRGAGESGGTVRLLDPALEGQDLLQILDWAEANLPWLQYRDNNLVLGSIGASYGGGYQHTIFAIDPKKRLDAIAPEITWYDLRYSLFSGGTRDTRDQPRAGAFKSFWANVLVGIGGSRQDSEVQEGLAEGLSQNMLSADKLALLYRVSLASHCEGDNAFTAGVGTGNGGALTAVDALYWQSTGDTLFNMNDMFDNYRCVEALGGDVRMLTKVGGHDDSFGGGSGEVCGGIDKVTSIQNFFDEKLKLIPNAAVDVPKFCFSLGAPNAGNDAADAVVVDQLPIGGEFFDVQEQSVTTSTAAETSTNFLLKTVGPGGEVLAGLPVASFIVVDALPGDREAGDPIVFAGIGVKRAGANQTAQPTLFMANQVRPIRGYGVFNIELTGLNIRLNEGDEVYLMLYAGYSARYPNAGSREATPITVRGSIELPLFPGNTPAP
jgi:VCBS repeat-containing protein